MQKKRRALLNQSFAWIRQHPNATNHDVPTDLLERWIFEADEEEQRPAGFYLSVFSFGYMLHEVMTRGASTDQPSSIPLSRLLSHFELWQLKLGLVEVHRKADVRIDPLPLFAFADGEKVTFWPNTSTRTCQDMHDVHEKQNGNAEG